MGARPRERVRLRSVGGGPRAHKHHLFPTRTARDVHTRGRVHGSARDIRTISDQVHAYARSLQRTAFAEGTTFESGTNVRRRRACRELYEEANRSRPPQFALPFFYIYVYFIGKRSDYI